MESITFAELLHIAKKHLKAILISTVCVTALAAGLSFLTSGSSQGTYIAVAAIQCDDYSSSDEQTTYDYSVPQNPTINTARYASVTEDVVSAALEEIGIDRNLLTISSPYPKDKNNNQVGMDVVFIAVSSNDFETSRVAANAIAEKAVKKILDELEYENASILHEAIPLAEVKVDASLGLSESPAVGRSVSNKSLVLGFGVGFFGSLICVWCFELLGSKIRSRRDIAIALDLPVLAQIRVRDLALLPDNFSAAHEPIQLLRSTLLPTDREASVAICLAEASAQGDNSQLSFLLGEAFAAAGYSTCLIDATGGGLAAAMQPSKGLVLEICDSNEQALDDYLASAAFAKRVADIREQFEIVLLAVPALDRASLAVAAAPLADEFIMVVREACVKGLTLRESLMQLEKVGVLVLGTVFITK